ncbi:MAG: hypothetical protein HZB54_01630, partial [Deltaproteobacteria bacterium]|nr:hypothetical protein [Deltaproteobacteria bacterium]
TINAMRFEINAEENLFKLSEELENKTYKPVRSVCFIVERPKMREIIAADFRDRVVHHVLIERLEAIYEPIFIYDSYACRKDKGLHRAVETVREFIRRGSENGRKKLYFIHMDIRNFFMTIDRKILFQMLDKKLRRLSAHDDLLWLAQVIIFHSPTENCILKGKEHLIKQMPPHKSLFHAPENRGLPVGNLTSQFFANLYLNELDQYVKHTIKHRYYVRYCDDFLILDVSPERLKEIKERIKEFVADKLNLSFNDRYNSIIPVSNGIDFLGYVIRQDYTLVRRRVVNNLKTKLGWFEKKLVSHSSRAIEQQSSESSFPQYVSGNPDAVPRLNRGNYKMNRFPFPDYYLRGQVSRETLDARLSLPPQVVSGGHPGMTNICLYKYDYELLEQLRSVLASYLGHLKWADSYSLKGAILKRYSFLKEYFSFPCLLPSIEPFEHRPAGTSDDERVKPLYRYSAIFPSVKSQYLYYSCKFRDMVIFFQVGCFYEFYGEIKNDVMGTLGLKRLKNSQRRAMYGFPVRLGKEYLKRLVDKGIPIIIIRETDRYIGRIKQRLPVLKITKTREGKTC